MAHIIVIGGHGKVATAAGPHPDKSGATGKVEVSSVFRNPDHTDEVAATAPSPCGRHRTNSYTHALPSC